MAWGSWERLLILWFEKAVCFLSLALWVPGCSPPPLTPALWKPVGNRHSAPTVTELRTKANATSLTPFVAWALGTHNLGPGWSEDWMGSCNVKVRSVPAPAHQLKCLWDLPAEGQSGWG